MEERMNESHLAEPAPSRLTNPFNPFPESVDSHPFNPFPESADSHPFNPSPGGGTVSHPR
jgi:hypothetical protein